MDGLNGRLKMAGERVSELEDRAIAGFQSEITEMLGDLYDDIKGINKYIIRIPE